MHRSSTSSMMTLTPQLVFLLLVGGCVCIFARQLSAERVYSLRYPTEFKRPSYQFGLGKRSVGGGEEDLSLEEQQLSPLDLLLEKEGIGKRARAYGFGLGKRQERRSKIYSFGLGKRQSSHDLTEDYYDGGMNVERRASPQRQFAFGLGKRDPNAKE